MHKEMQVLGKNKEKQVLDKKTQQCSASSWASQRRKFALKGLRQPEPVFPQMPHRRTLVETLDHPFQSGLTALTRTYPLETETLSEGGKRLVDGVLTGE